MREMTYEHARDLLVDALLDCGIYADFVYELGPEELASELADAFWWNITIDTKNNVFQINNLH